MTARHLFVCADVGGTFTDCLAAWTDEQGELHNGCIKVLSTGQVRCEVVRLVDGHTIEVDLPDELLGGREDRRLPRDFFRSAKVFILVDGVSHSIGSIASYSPEDSTITLCDLREEIGDLFRAGCIVEIDCGIEAPVLATYLLLGIPICDSLPSLTARVGTTRGTNALLTRSGATTALVVTEGFGDVLLIGEQDRPELFDLSFTKPPPLAENLMEVRGRTDSKGEELIPLNPDEIMQGFETLRQMGVETVSICLMHAHVNPNHELVVEELARQAGFQNISRSSEVAPLIKLVSRAETTTLDAYLSPILTDYVRRVRRQFGGATCQLELMTSGGNLIEDSEFRGRDSVLSGPAGGVVGLKFVAETHDCDLAIGLDMGGTSTDVSRFDGQVGRRYESRIADLRVMTPMMDIHTVAAGGGSICDFTGGRLVVGPTSAGASPGPACYARGGPLTVTDINVLLGRLRVDRFPFPLVPEASAERIKHVASRMPTPPESLELLAEGFLYIAVTHMAEAVRAITTARGVDVRDHTLVGFGGAAAQHICRVADALGITKIIDHPRGSVLCAVGLGVALPGRIETVGIYRNLAEVAPNEFLSLTEELVARTRSELEYQDGQSIVVRLECDCRYVGTDVPIAIELSGPAHEWMDSMAGEFHRAHEGRFGYRRSDQAIELVSLRCEAKTGRSGRTDELLAAKAKEASQRLADDGTGEPMAEVYHRGSWKMFRLVERSDLHPGDELTPSSLVVSDQSTLVIEPNWTGKVESDGAIVLQRKTETRSQTQFGDVDEAAGAIRMEIVARRLQSVADAMGEVLRRTAVSVNVKERLDFSCAVFSGDGTLIANAPHVPVHLGAMGHTVRDLAAQFPQMSEGDCYVSNDPYRGGSHLPDVTVVTPVFCDSDESSKPTFFVASRAHHAEIGGKTPGSMPPLATSLAEEGVLIRGFALVRDGISHESELKDLLAGAPYPSRDVDENMADLRAQIAAGQEGVRGLRQMVEEFSFSHVESMSNRLLDVAAESVGRWIAGLPRTAMAFQDTLDDGTIIAVRLQRQADRLIVDFEGTSDVHAHGFNATPSIVSSAVLYVMRCFCDSNLPLCEGVLRPIELRIPVGLLSPPADPDPNKCAAVVAGNVETSQRVVDVLLGAIGTSEVSEGPVFRSVAASQGTMNNVLIGDESFGYYETIGGGSGATVFGPGADGVHTHMTNTRITDPEVLESRLPIRLKTFAIRQGSGGKGRHRGGDGLIREFEFLRPLTVSLITSRRTTAPYGAQGGHPGVPGSNRLIRVDGADEALPSSITVTAEAGDRLRIETPGGGGWGNPE